MSPGPPGQETFKFKVMKLRKLFFIGAILLALLACEDPDTFYETQAEIEIEIPIQSQLLENTYMLKDSPVDMYSLKGMATFCLANSNEFKQCPGMVTQVRSTAGAMLLFEGLQNKEEINSLVLEWGYQIRGTMDVHMQAPIDLLHDGPPISKDLATLDLDQVLMPVIGNMDEQPQSIIFIKITGYSNFDVMLDAKLKIPLVVESELLTPRFTL